MQTFLAACMDFFGLKEGQTKMDFGKEFIKLTDADKTEIYDGFQKIGIACERPIAKPVKAAA